MVCAICDFGAPCLCERKRRATQTANLSVRPAAFRQTDVDRLKSKLHDASNMIAALLLAQHGNLPSSLKDEAENLLETLRAENP